MPASMRARLTDSEDVVNSAAIAARVRPSTVYLMRSSSAKLGVMISLHERLSRRGYFRVSHWAAWWWI